MRFLLLFYIGLVATLFRYIYREKTSLNKIKCITLYRSTGKEESGLLTVQGPQRPRSTPYHLILDNLIYRNICKKFETTEVQYQHLVDLVSQNCTQN